LYSTPGRRERGRVGFHSRGRLGENLQESNE
jgi:hypothetical protein